MNHGTDAPGPEGLDADELALRRLLQHAVEDIEPRDGTLEHLRGAVPLRRARKRQAAVGMAAAALFLCTAVPALVHVSNAAGNADPSIAANSSEAQGTTQGKSPSGGEGTSGGSAGGVSAGAGGTGQKSGDKGSGSAGGSGSTGAADPSASTGATAPVCTATQLGSATGTVASPDSAGIVYGSFHVTNVSTASCTVGGQGSVTTLAQGGADATKITVVQHVAGDAATGLPDPSTEVPQLVLLPGAAYEVKFAWVPSAACPSTGTTTGGGTGGSDTGGASADPTPTQDAGVTSSTGGTSTQLVREDGTTDGSVVVSHTTEEGSPTVSATVSGACEGTVYRTGVLAAS
ncbi:hypothetical protein WN71_001930 [Streptomyces mangrovisoli]|uniref:DUF4232 domain-containing protein n=1 Tax=Streptomyces mangrovisoli TaxID=1428628 RepID=A0A1J4P4R3_9ACTN|nr:hypothetical protein WN71_001930 [Streptomyces mangrovisoli]